MPHDLLRQINDAHKRIKEIDAEISRLHRERLKIFNEQSRLIKKANKNDQ